MPSTHNQVWGCLSPQVTLQNLTSRQQEQKQQTSVYLVIYLGSLSKGRFCPPLSPFFSPLSFFLKMSTRFPIYSIYHPVYSFLTRSINWSFTGYSTFHNISEYWILKKTCPIHFAGLSQNFYQLSLFTYFVRYQCSLSEISRFVQPLRTVIQLLRVATIALWSKQ